MADENAVVSVPVPDFRLIARNPHELEASRQSLIVFFNATLDALQKERGDLNANLAIAEKFPIKTQPIIAQIKRTQKRIDFYTKARAAVEAGFHIIPNFDAEIFAIRTDRSARGSGSITTWGRQSALNGMPNQKAQLLPAGEGNYKSPNPRGTVATWNETNKEGKEVTKYHARVTDFGEVDFPFVLARPEVLSATQQVMADKIFDELGALPNRSRGADPMVVGIIKESNDRGAKQLTFLVVWFLDTNTL